MKRKKLLSEEECKNKRARTDMQWVAKLTEEERNVYTGLTGSDLGKDVPNPIKKIITNMCRGFIYSCFRCDEEVFKVCEDE
jgi:hypothetical protein